MGYDIWRDVKTLMIRIWDLIGNDGSNANHVIVNNNAENENIKRGTVLRIYYILDSE